MPYTLEQLSQDIRQVLLDDNNPGEKQRICEYVSKALRDNEFIAKHVTPEACKPRKVLYEDPELGFCICAHLYGDANTGKPHDHGSTWAIYGVANGTTEMTEWKIVKQGSGDTPSLVEPVRSYEMKPGDCQFYEAGDVHSPRMSAMTKLIRVEGANLDHVQRSNIQAA
jgi:hypothetical protein